MASHWSPGATLFSEAGRKCACGWETFWAKGHGDLHFVLAYCERCGAYVAPVKES